MESEESEGGSSGKGGILVDFFFFGFCLRENDGSRWKPTFLQGSGGLRFKS